MDICNLYMVLIWGNKLHVYQNVFLKYLVYHVKCELACNLYINEGNPSEDWGLKYCSLDKMPARRPEFGVSEPM